MNVSCLAAVIQLCSTPDREENLTEAKKQMTEAVSRGAKLLVLPENFSHMGLANPSTSLEEKQRLHYREDPKNSPSLVFLQQFARQHQVWIVGGSIPLAVDGSNKITNTCFVVDSAGQVQGRYDKIHRFDADLGGETAYRESDLVQAGNAPVCVDTPFGRIGLALCYDLRFPELFRRLSSQGATILTLPSAFTLTTGRDHWEVLLRARAIENFAYVLAPGQSGRHVNGRQTFGHSLVVEPWGHLIAQCPDGAGFCLAELQPHRLEQCRARMPCLHHRVDFL